MPSSSECHPRWMLHPLSSVGPLRQTWQCGRTCTSACKPISAAPHWKCMKNECHVTIHSMSHQQMPSAHDGVARGWHKSSNQTTLVHPFTWAGLIPYLVSFYLTESWNVMKTLLHMPARTQPKIDRLLHCKTGLQTSKIRCPWWFPTFDS